MARVLMIDDEPNIRMMVRLALQHDGHTVGAASDGEEGLERYGDGGEWDLVLLDQRMPGMDGIEVLKRIRTVNWEARIIMITAFGTVDLAVEAMKLGAADFLRKPFTTEMLRGAVETALEEMQARSAAPVTFSMTTINGFRIAFESDAGEGSPDAIDFPFTVKHPDGVARPCLVTLPPSVKEQIKAYLGCASVPEKFRFWQAVCEEALSNYIYQNADFPLEDSLRIEEFTLGLRRFIDTISQGV